MMKKMKLVFAISILLNHQGLTSNIEIDETPGSQHILNNLLILEQDFIQAEEYLKKSSQRIDTLKELVKAASKDGIEDKDRIDLNFHFQKTLQETANIQYSLSNLWEDSEKWEKVHHSYIQTQTEEEITVLPQEFWDRNIHFFLPYIKGMVKYYLSDNQGYNLCTVSNAVRTYHAVMNLEINLQFSRYQHKARKLRLQSLIRINKAQAQPAILITEIEAGLEKMYQYALKAKNISSQNGELVPLDYKFQQIKNHVCQINTYAYGSCPRSEMNARELLGSRDWYSLNLNSPEEIERTLLSLSRKIKFKQSIGSR